MNVCVKCNRKLSACNSAGVKYFSTHPRGLSDATVLQTVAKRETVEADASTVEKGGTMALRSLGRHTILQAGRPHPPPTPRLLPAELAVGECNGRAPRVWRADARACGPSIGSGWTPVPTQGARPLSAARGGDSLRCSPTSSPALGGLSSLGRTLPSGAPCRALTVWARCGLRGCR